MEQPEFYYDEFGFRVNKEGKIEPLEGHFAGVLGEDPRSRVSHYAADPHSLVDLLFKSKLFRDQLAVGSLCTQRANLSYTRFLFVKWTVPLTCVVFRLILLIFI